MKCQDILATGTDNTTDSSFDVESLASLLTCAHTLFASIQASQKVNISATLTQFLHDVEAVWKGLLKSTNTSSLFSFRHCGQELQTYRTISESFSTLWNTLNEGNISAVDMQNLAMALKSLFASMKTYVDNDVRASVIKTCFSFEEHFWWRITNFAHCKSRDYVSLQDMTSLKQFNRLVALQEASMNFSQYCPEHDLMVEDDYVQFMSDPFVLKTSHCLSNNQNASDVSSEQYPFPSGK